MPQAIKLGWDLSATLTLPVTSAAEHLDGELAVVLHVVGQADGRHPAVAELALQRVAIVESLAERRDNAGQGCCPC